MNKNSLLFLTVVSVSIFLTCPAGGLGMEINWKSYDEGMTESKKQGRKVFLHFMADWCGYCKKMDSVTFSDERVIAFLNTHFVAVRVNGDHEEKIREIYGVRGYPDNRFLDNNRKQVYRTPGFINAETFMFFLEYIHTDSYKTMDPMQYYKSR